MPGHLSAAGNSYTHRLKRHIPPLGSQPPFQPPGSGTGGGGAPHPTGPGPPHPGPPPRHGGGGAGRQSVGTGANPGPGSALATPAPTPTAPAASPPATARPATIFIGLIMDSSFVSTAATGWLVTYQRCSFRKLGTDCAQHQRCFSFGGANCPHEETLGGFTKLRPHQA
jgi:hypothetical protein